MSENYGLDFEKKLIICSKTIVPTGDVETDMKEIKEYFKNFKLDAFSVDWNNEIGFAPEYLYEQSIPA